MTPAERKQLMLEKAYFPQLLGIRQYYASRPPLRERITLPTALATVAVGLWLPLVAAYLLNRL